MQVRPRGSPGLADGTHGGACAKSLAGSDVDRAQMAIHADEAASVIDKYRLAVEEVVARIDDGACDRYSDQGTGSGRDVHAGMGIA